jgi:hypothetical protein
VPCVNAGNDYLLVSLANDLATRATLGQNSRSLASIVDVDEGGVRGAPDDDITLAVDGDRPLLLATPFNIGLGVRGAVNRVAPLLPVAVDVMRAGDPDR